MLRLYNLSILKSMAVTDIYLFPQTLCAATIVNSVQIFTKSTLPIVGWEKRNYLLEHVKEAKVMNVAIVTG